MGCARGWVPSGCPSHSPLFKQALRRLAGEGAGGRTQPDPGPLHGPEDRARLESLSERYRNVEFRDALAEQFVVRGGWILLGLGACHMLLARIDRRAAESTTAGEG